METLVAVTPTAGTTALGTDDGAHEVETGTVQGGFERNAKTVCFRIPNHVFGAFTRFYRFQFLSKVCHLYDHFYSKFEPNFVFTFQGTLVKRGRRQWS